MSEKLSQVTEDVLSASDDADHTLAGMTSDTQSSTAGTNKNSGKSSGNKSMVIGLVVGIVVIAVGVTSYYTFLRPTNVVKAKNVNKKPVEKVETPTASLPPVSQPVAPVLPVAPVVPENNGFPQDMSKEGQVAANFLGVDQPGQIDVISQAGNEVAPVTQPVAPVLPVAPVTQPVAPVAPVLAEPLGVVAPVAPVLPTPQVEPVVAPSLATLPLTVNPPAKVEDTSINNAFDSVATRVDEVSTRVDGLEKFKLAQEDLNSKIDKRIVRLEGFHEGDGAGKKVANSGSVSSGVVHRPKPVVKPKPKPVAKPVVAKSEIDGDVLVDKSSVKTAKVENQKAKVAANRLEEYQFHSIYDGRVWVKNADGSLATYAEGERLPSGEVIKKIDHDAFKVVTDKRTILKR